MSTKKKKVTEDSKMWEILTEAKKYLWDGGERGESPLICDAVGRSLGSWYPNKVTNEIHARLEGYGSLESWLINCTSISMADVFNPGNTKKLQRTRLNWMNSMIEEFKAKDI